MEIITNILAFILAIIILVFVHEFGHYFVARKCGVKVLKFSIGFGKTLFFWQTKNTQYHIKAIPLGGFVEMLDSTKHKVDEHNKHLTFDNKNVYQRFIIVLAGPVANLILAFILYAVIFSFGYQDLAAVVGKINPNSEIANTNLTSGDTIIAINGDKTNGISAVINNIIATDDNLIITVIDKNNIQKTININFDNKQLLNNDKTLAQTLGFEFFLPKLDTTIGGIIKNSPAENAQLAIGDKIVAINNNSITTWQEISKAINTANNKQKINFQIQRDGVLWSKTITTMAKDDRFYLGVKPLIRDDYYISVAKDIPSAISSAVVQTYQFALLNIKVITNMIFGEISTKNISGPAKVAKYAGDSINTGFITFMKFLAAISISVAVINLLPIPLLDGGYLMFYSIEILSGIRASLQIQQFFNTFGLLIIVLMMVIALYNDMVYLTN